MRPQGVHHVSAGHTSYIRIADVLHCSLYVLRMYNEHKRGLRRAVYNADVSAVFYQNHGV